MIQSKVTQHEFTVVCNEQVAHTIWRLQLRSDVARDMQPGQFMNLQVPGDGSHILRIPLSFAWTDPETRLVEVLYAVVGEGTERLSHMALGETSQLTGPCGHGWQQPEQAGRALLVAGGIGLPPVSAAARMLAKAGMGFDAIVGARTVSMLPSGPLDELKSLGDDSCQVIVCTDDGSAGRRGFTTDAAAELLDSGSYTSVYTCGPNVMMAGVAKLAAAHEVSCQVSLERMMGCGFGACSCCNVALVGGGYALCCQDGPVFDAREVAW